MCAYGFTWVSKNNRNCNYKIIITNLSNNVKNKITLVYILEEHNSPVKPKRSALDKVVISLRLEFVITDTH